MAITSKLTSAGDFLVTNQFDEYTLQNNSYAVQFNGSSQYLSIPSSTALDIWTTSSSATLELWYYSTSATQIGHLFIMGPSGTNRVYLISQGSSLTLGTAIGGTFTTRITSGVSVVQNTWYHVAISRIGATYTLYVNGNSQGSSSLALYNNGGNGVPLYIGVQAYSPLAGDWFNGYISNFRIVNGGALYTQNFTPSGPLTTTVSSGTVSLLALQSASATTDGTGINTISNPASISMTYTPSNVINNPASVTTTPSTIIFGAPPAANDYLLLTDNSTNNQTIAPIISFTTSTGTNTYSLAVPTSNVSNLNINNNWTAQLWDPEVIPQATIKTNLPPVNPRENLYYAQLVKSKYGVQDFINSQLENNTSLFLTDTGLLTKYKTGAFGKGVADPSAAPKAPVQFWN